MTPSQIFNRIFRRPLITSLALFSVLPLLHAEETMFPFVMPGLSPNTGVTDVSWLNEMPAGKNGFVTIKNGCFVDGRGKRIKFLATNFTFSSAFPSHEDAEKLAARLASMGINCIRFHHMDNRPAPNGIWKNGTAKRNEFDPDQLDRLDYFIAQLKRFGIYADINLHVSRSYWEGEDFPDGLASDRERGELLPKYGKGIDKINDQMIRMQRDYARALLTHVNPYTKNAYASEPSVVIVEINNENTLMDLKVGTLPEYYRREIGKKWCAWLKTRYESIHGLRQAWGDFQPLGENILPKKWDMQGSQYFKLTEEDGVTHIVVEKLPEISWQAQLHKLNLTLQEGNRYTVEFKARSPKPRKLAASVRLQKSDWHNCGFNMTADLTPEWKTFSANFKAVRVEPGALRLDFVLGTGPVGDLWIKDLVLRSGGSSGLKPGESFEAENIASGEGCDGKRHDDWISFLAQTERNYTGGMRDFLKKELHVRGNIIDTQASYGEIVGCYRESTSDFVDMHAYWQHPRFPHKPWDGNDWNVPNTPMVDSATTGNFMRLAMYRVAAKPFAVSEYDHPAPSHYAAEMFPMIASFGAVQDWDAIFQFDYGTTNWCSGMISGYFQLEQHPAKLAFLPVAALMFRRADVPPAVAQLHLSIPVGEVEKMKMLTAWEKVGTEPSEILKSRIEVGFATEGELEATRSGEPKSAIDWNFSSKIYTVDAPAAKVVVGRCTGKVTVLKGAQFDVKSNSRNFAVLALSAADAKPVSLSRRLLLVAAGNVENTGMGWNEDHTSVGRKWGKTPTVCEGIAGNVSIDTTSKSATVYALDPSGKRGATVPSAIRDGKLSFEIGSQFKTLWFEIEAK